MAFFTSVLPPLGVVVLTVAGLNVFFFKNRRLFSLLEKEDWPALADYLGKKVYGEKRYTSRDVRLLAQALLVRGQFGETARLEKTLAAEKPELLEENALLFGSARLLSEEPAVAAEFFLRRLEKGRVAEAEWLRWYYGFALSLAGDLNRARDVLADLAADAKSGFIAGLSAYSVSRLPALAVSTASVAVMGKKGRNAPKNIAAWEREAARVKKEVHGAIIGKYLDKAGEWLFDGEVQTAPSGGAAV